MKKIDTDIEKTLQSLDGVVGAKAPADFYARLQAKINQLLRFRTR